MPHRRWADKVDDALARRGVPATARIRLLAELRDHADDLTDGEGLTMTDELMAHRLGEPDALAAAAAEEYRRGRWTSRHPLLVFGLLPVPAMILTFIVTVMGFELSAYVLGMLFVDDIENLPRPALVALAYSLAWGVRFVPFLVLAVLFTRAYLKSRVNRWWFVVAAAQVLLFAGSFISTLDLHDEPGKSAWMMGFAWVPMPVADGWTLPFAPFVGWTQVLQAAVPAAAGILMIRASRRKQAALGLSY